MFAVGMYDGFKSNEWKKEIDLYHTVSLKLQQLSCSKQHHVALRTFLLWCLHAFSLKLGPENPTQRLNIMFILVVTAP